MSEIKSTVTFSTAQGYQIGDVVRFAQPPAPKWWRRLEAWRRVFGFKPRTWRKLFKVVELASNAMTICPYE